MAAAGRPAAAAIERGATPHQRVVTATLGTIAETVEREGIRPPADRDRGWFAITKSSPGSKSAPLRSHGRGHPGARKQAGRLAAMRAPGEGDRDAGDQSETIEASDPRIEEPFRQLREGCLRPGLLHQSGRVSAFFELIAGGRAGRQGAGRRHGCRDRSLALPGSLRPRGMNPIWFPDRAVAEGLLEGSRSEALEGKRVLIPGRKLPVTSCLTASESRGAGSRSCRSTGPSRSSRMNR